MRVNMDSSIVSEARFRLLGKRLGISLNETIGACFHVWLDCYNRRSEKATAAEIDIVSSVDGFAAAMVSEKLAHATKDGAQIVIHGVRERIKFLKAQQEKGKRGARVKKENRRKSIEAKEDTAQANATANANGVAEAYSPAPAPALSPAPAQKTEEKTCSEPSPTASEPVAMADPVVMEFPCAEIGVVWKLRQSKIDEYRISFPGVDLNRELLKARQWCIDNATRRKTPSGMPKFLGTWLGKAQNESGSQGMSGRPRGRAEQETDYAARTLEGIL